MSIGCNSRYNQGTDRSFKYGKGFCSGWSRLDLTVSLLVLWEKTLGEMSSFVFSYLEFLISCRFLAGKSKTKFRPPATLLNLISYFEKKTHQINVM